MKYRFTLSTEIAFSTAVTNHVFRIRPIPADFPGQRVLDAHMTTSAVRMPMSVTDRVTGNITWVGRIDQPHDVFVVHSEGVVETTPSNQEEFAPQPYFVFPTCLTRPEGEVFHLWEQVAKSLEGDANRDAMKLMHAAAKSLTYCPGVTNTRTTAQQALILGQGVCQDYAHVLIALLRLAGIPALYVAGLVQGTGQTHAWVHAWIGGRWIAMDPTHDRLAEAGYVVLARGCDFEDAALERGIFLGSARQSIRTTAHVEAID